MPSDDDHGETELISGPQQPHEEVEALLIPSGGSADEPTKKRATSMVKKASATSSNSIDSAPGTQSKKSRGKGTRKGSSSGGGDESATAKFIKYAALFLLVAQMVGLVLLMRYSRTQPRAPDQPLYLASTAVFVMEVMKLIICLVVILVQSNGRLCQQLVIHILQSPYELLKLCVPSLLYCIQNNLLYLALTNLDAATYQVCYQLKILTTALFSAVLLGRRFSKLKWFSLVILTIGVAIVQISGSGDHHSNHTHDNDATADHHQQQQKEDVEDAENAQNRVIGLIAVLCAACTSGFSGVYFEKILKGSRTSLWIRNVQMGLPSTIIAYVTCYIKDGDSIREIGFLGGYTKVVWTVVSVQAVGGLIVAVVVRYADNVLKVFATSFSIIISCIISSFLFDFHPTWSFLLGAGFVVTATVLYSSPERSSSSGALIGGKRRRTAKPLLPVTSSASK